MQNNFHIAKRDGLATLEGCAQAGIGLAPFFPLGGGRTEINNERLAKVAARHDATVSQIALAWLLSLPPVALAIPGTGSIEHLEENTAAGSITLSAADLADLD